jgi:DNA-directed RNA polymerase specialized sigma24 family protein
MSPDLAAILDPLQRLPAPVEVFIPAPTAFKATIGPDTVAEALPGSPKVEVLLARMRAGDRDAAAEFVLRYGDRIRRRVRGKLGSSMRRLFDSLEILSTLGRRLDLYVMKGKLQAASEGQLWALVFQMADRALVDKTRVFKNLQNVEGEDSEFAAGFSRRLRWADASQSSGAEIEIDQCLQQLDSGVDRQILSLWLAGEPLAEIAQHVAMAATAVRKRWVAIKHRLRDRLAAD